MFKLWCERGIRPISLPNRKAVSYTLKTAITNNDPQQRDATWESNISSLSRAISITVSSEDVMAVKRTCVLLAKWTTKDN